MNIYQIELNGEKEYVCANTAIEAIQTLLKTHGMLFGDLDHTDDIKQLPKEEWGTRSILDDAVDEEGNYITLMTFEEFMKSAVTPEVFCSTANM